MRLVVTAQKKWEALTLSFSFSFSFSLSLSLSLNSLRNFWVLF
jgi:hypothetical protein